MKSTEIPGNSSGSAKKGVLPENYVAQLDFTSIFAQFISMISLQNIEILQKNIASGKMVVDSLYL